nr:DUF4127 family protein [Deinobacterium chartae]
MLIPPDTRPPTLEHPVQLARALGLETLTPPPAALPDLNVPGDFGAMQDWLRAHAPEGDVLIVCLETLCLGGMIPARRVTTPLEEALRRLQLLEEIKRAHPGLRIYAYGVIVRVAHDNDPLEEKEYYGQWGRELRAYSTAFDRFERHRLEEDRALLEAARAALPPEILTDWVSTRERNRALHLRALDLLAEGVLEHLCLTLDDTTPYGLAAFDRRLLEARTDERGLWRRVDIYPGADEVPVTLLARALSERTQNVYVRYSSLLGDHAEMIYEDRPLGELIKAHLRAAGCRRVDRLEQADFVLAVNVPATRQSNVRPDFVTVDTAGRHLPEFVDFLEGALSEPTPVTLADVAYPNGADPRLWQLMQDLPLARLAGYSAWNTAGNTLGSAIAFGALAGRPRLRERHLEALLARMIDDALYQGELRARVRERLDNPSPYDLGPQRARAEELVAELVEPRARALWERHFAQEGFRLRLGRPHLAWPRLFTGVFPLEVEA